jgi:Zn-dependent protease with chaperone function
LLGTLAGTLIALYIIHLLMEWAMKKDRLKGDKHQMTVILTLFLLFSSIVTFISDPISNTISRQAEKRADLYAVKLTKDPEAGITAFQKLTENSLTQVNPPFIVKFLRYDHPTMLERLRYLEDAEKKK